MTGQAGGSPPDDADVPGVAGERTDLAWSRTGLSVVVCAGAIARKVWEQFDGRTVHVVVFAIVSAGALAWSVAMRWGAQAARTTVGGRRVAGEAAGEAALRHLVWGTTAFAVAALALSI